MHSPSKYHFRRTTLQKPLKQQPLQTALLHHSHNHPNKPKPPPKPQRKQKLTPPKRAWGKDQDPSGDSKIRFLADPAAEFTKALGDVDFDATPVLGNVRSKRYAITTEDGVVKSVAVEADNTGLDVSAVDKVLS